MWGIIGGFALLLALLSPLVLGSTKKVERLFKSAETLYNQNDYEGSIVMYNKALKESNKFRSKTEIIDKDFTTYVNLKIAMSYVKLAEHKDNPSHYEKALEYVEKAARTVKLVEYEENLTYHWGHILHKTGQLEQALEKFRQLLDKFPNSRFAEKAQETIAQIDAQLQDTEETVMGRAEIVPLWINDLSKFEAFNKAGNRRLVVPNRLRTEEKFAQAAEEYETFANDYPFTQQAAYALYWAGFCYSPDSTATLSDKSIDVFQKLIDNYPESLYAAKARERLESIPAPYPDLDETIRKVEKAVQELKVLNCESPAVDTVEEHLVDAKKEKARNNYEAAYQWAKNAEELAKNATEAHKKAEGYVEAGYLRLRQGELNRAKANADAARGADPSYPKIRELSKEIKQQIERKNNHFSRGVEHFENRAYARAIDSLTKALEIDLQFKEAYYRLGAAYLKSGEFECALECARKALAIDSNYEDASDLMNSIDTDALNDECEHDIP